MFTIFREKRDIEQNTKNKAKERQKAIQNISLPHFTKDNRRISNKFKRKKSFCLVSSAVLLYDDDGQAMEYTYQSPLQWMI